MNNELRIMDIGKNTSNRGMILVETMIAISVLVTGLLGIFSLMSRSLSLNRVIMDQEIAVNLAAEGIELVKNKLDGNILQRLPWNDGINPGEYEIDFDKEMLLPNENRKIRYDSSLSEYVYDRGETTKFIRIIKIEMAGNDEIEVNSVVSWVTRGSGSFSINLEDRFFNWRQK